MDLLRDETPERELALLTRWEGRDVVQATLLGPRPGDTYDEWLRPLPPEPPGAPLDDGSHRRVARAIARYEVFPPTLLRGVLRRAPIVEGDTVGIRYRGFPLLDLFFAARVARVFDGPDGELWRTGFTYRSIEGHPELGEETFSVEKDLARGEVRVALRAWSRPGLLVSRAFSPLLRRLQVTASRAALDHLEALSRRGG